MGEPTNPQRLRITFAKTATLRFTGHLDLAKTWERVLRRANMPLLYSQGFNPQPKMQMAAALPLGISSECELLDIWLAERVETDSLPEHLNALSPPGLITREVKEVSLRAPALQTQTCSAEYHITVDKVDGKALHQRIAALLAQDHVERERRGKTYDLRPLILSLKPESENSFCAHLCLGDQGTARPDEVLAALGFLPMQARCHRLSIHLKSQEGATVVGPE